MSMTPMISDAGQNEQEESAFPEPEQQQEAQKGFDYKSDDVDHLKKALAELKDKVYMEARTFRDSKMRMWRRNEAFWLNIQRAIWSTTLNNFVDSSNLFGSDNEEIDPEAYNRIINIYRAHGESFIAALSAALPSPVYTPDDADNPDDIMTAKGYKKLSDLISIRNEAVTKFIKMLYHLYNHGVAFNYSIYHRDKKFGTVKNPVIGYKDVSSEYQACPECSGDMPDSQDISAPQMNSLDMASEPNFAPADNQSSQCAQCGFSGPSTPSQRTEQIPHISHYDETPKGNSTIEVFGPLNVTVPYNVRTLEFAGYVRLDMDLDEGLVKELYPGIKLNAGGVDGQDKYNRIPPNDFYTENTTDQALACLWFRPWMFNRLSDDLASELKERFPRGAYCVFVGDEFAEASEECLDDVWTSTEFPTSERIHNEPLGNVIIPIQEMTNDLTSLTMETIEMGIPVNFFDANMIDREEFVKHSAEPGDFIPAKARPGQSLDSSFASVKPAVLSREVEPFAQSLTQSAQFVLGTFPSIYGGSQQGGSKTLGELRDSKAQAMQRLSIPWIAASVAWCKTLKKSASLMIDNMIEGEDFKTVKRIGNSFVNVWVKEIELKGKVGEVSVESSDQIPMSFNQKRTLVMDMIGQGNQMFMQWMTHPENISFFARMIGLSDLFIPGDSDRDKQLVEIFELIKAQPIPGPPDPNGQEQMAPSVEIDPEIDAHPVHIEVLKSFLVSAVGMELKKSNPAGYQNCMAHFNAHNMYMQHMQQQQMQMQNPQGAGNNNQEAPQGPPQG